MANSKKPTPDAETGTNSDPTTEAGNAILATDESGTIVSVNSGVTDLFGYLTDELLGKPLTMLMPHFFDGEQETLKLNSGPTHETTGLRKDKTSFPVQLTFTEFEIDRKRFYTGIIRDTSDTQVRQSRLEAILDNAVDAIITITERGLIDSVNPATETVFGYSAVELIGQNIKMLMPDPYRREHDGYIHNYNTSGIKKIIGIGREVVGQRKNGSIFPMHLAVSEIHIRGRRMFTGIVRDISDLKKAEQELAEANEKLEERVKQRTAELHEAQADLVRSEKFATLGKVSGGIAHEIRNPLNAVKTSAYYLLNANNPSDEKVREHLERIDRQVTLIDNVVTALSDVAKLPDANLHPTKLSKVLSSAINSIGLASNIEVVIEFEESLPEVLVDENQILIAFKNLIRNARDAMPEGGKITLSASSKSESVSFHVADTGTGIADDELEKIMEPLYTTKARGMGLGLSITRAIVEKNQGQLSVESKLNRGSCFTIELKRA